MTATGSTHDVLVDAAWAGAHLDDPSVRFVEVDVDTTSYDQSHLPGAVGWDWTSQLADGVRRDIATPDQFSGLLSRSGIRPDTTIVLYGDNNNWFAAWAYWQLKLYGHRDVRILDGGRKYWLDHGLPITVDTPRYPETGYRLAEPDYALRAFRDDILPRLGDSELVLVDADWAKAHLTDPNVRFVEVDVDTTAYEQSHIPGAVGWNWTSQLSDGIRRDIASREDFSALL